jgi:hypothetical protein
MKTAFFSMEATGTRTFAGYSDGQQWNGWERPYFPFDSAQHIAEAMSDYQTAFYDEAADEFVFERELGEAERFGAVEFDGSGKLYPIGAGAWIWECQAAGE